MTIIPDNKDKYLIYAIRLTHDLSQEYRYVGKSSKGVQRFRDHLSAANSTKNPEYDSAKYRWIRKHYASVTFDILDILGTDDLLGQTEMQWIHIFRSRGYRLLNMTDGGEGASGYRHSEEHKEYMRKVLTGHPVSQTTRDKIGSAQKGRLWTDTRKSEHSLRLTGVPKPEESRVNYSQSKMGEKNPQFGLKGELSPTYGMTHTDDAKLIQRQAAFRQHHSYGRHDKAPRAGCLECLPTIGSN